MRFLIDNACSPRVAVLLCDGGHDVIHVRDRGLQRASDALLFDLAAEEDRIVVSADTDFGTLLAQRRTTHPSVILFRGEIARRPADQVALLRANLPQLEVDLLSGSVIVIEPGRIRIRALPIG